MLSPKWLCRSAALDREVGLNSDAAAGASQDARLSGGAMRARLGVLKSMDPLDKERVVSVACI